MPPPPFSDEPFNINVLQEIKTETANLLLRVERNLFRQSDQRNQLRFANQIFRDENQALHIKIRDLETKLSESILLSEHIQLQHQHTQEVGRLTTDLQQMERILASLREQHEVQETTLHNSYIETKQLQQFADAQVLLITELRKQLAQKEEDMANLVWKMNNPDMRLLYVRASLRESQASLAKVQDEADSLRLVVATQREEIFKLRARSTTEPTSSSVANDGLLQDLVQGQGRLSSEVMELRQMAEWIVSAVEYPDTVFNHPTPYKNYLSARSSVKTLPVGGGLKPDLPTSHGSRGQPTLPESQRSASPVPDVSTRLHVLPGKVTSTIPIHFPRPLPPTNTNRASNDSFRHLSSTPGSDGERYTFPDVYSSSDENTPAFDVVSTSGESSQSSQPARIDPFPYEYAHELSPPTPAHSQYIEHSSGVELEEIKAEGARLTLQMERFLQQQGMTQIDARATILTDRSRNVETAHCDIRQLHEDLKLLTKKLKDKEVECESLKKP